SHGRASSAIHCHTPFEAFCEVLLAAHRRRRETAPVGAVVCAHSCSPRVHGEKGCAVQPLFALCHHAEASHTCSWIACDGTSRNPSDVLTTVRRCTSRALSIATGDTHRTASRAVCALKAGAKEVWVARSGPHDGAPVVSLGGHAWGGGCA